MFVTRLVSGIVLLVIAFCGFYIGNPLLTAILLLISLIGYRELMKALGVTVPEKGRRFSVPEGIGYLGITVYYIIIFLFENQILNGDLFVYLLAVIVFLFLAEMFSYVFTFPKYQAEQAVASIFSFLYAPVMLSFIELVRARPEGKYLVWIILISSWGCDTCAYCVGKLIGKKKIFPILSPKKSLEGCIGGVLGATVLGTVYGWFFMGKSTENLIAYALICAFGALASMVGDLAASAIKRNKQIKDYGTLIPGHGGIMDRFDSVIVTAPMVYFLAYFLLNVS